MMPQELEAELDLWNPDHQQNMIIRTPEQLEKTLYAMRLESCATLGLQLGEQQLIVNANNDIFVVMAIIGEEDF